MKWLALFALILLTSLHRGGISIQAHLLWMIGLLPLFILTFRENKNWKNEKITLSLLAGFIFFIFISYAFSETESYGFLTLSGFIGGSGIFLIVSQWGNEEKIQKLLKWITLLATVYSIIGIGIYLTKPPDRLFGVFANFPTLFSNFPNAFALFLLIAIPTAFEFLIKTSEKKWAFINAILLSALIISFSRSSWIALIAVGLACAIVFRKKLSLIFWKKITATFLLTIILTAGIQFIRSQTFPTNTITQKITLRAQENKTSVSDRLDFWKGSLKLIGEKPFFGHGPDTFEFIFPKYQTNLLANSSHPHNFLVKTAVENGLITTIFFIALIMWIFFQTLKNPNPFSKKLLIPISLIILHNLLDYNLNFASNNILFWSLLGFTQTLKTHQKKYAWNPVLIGIFTGMIFIMSFYEIYQRSIIVSGRNFIANKEIEQGLEKFEKAKPIFRQDLDVLQAEAYRLLEKKEAIPIVEKMIEKNPAIGELKNILAALASLNNEKRKALFLVNAGIKQDPKNQLKLYYHQASLQKELNLPIDKKMLNALLAEYLTLLRKNAHNTIASENPKYAIKIAQLLENDSFEKKLKFFTHIEQKKFEKMYEIKLQKL